MAPPLPSRPTFRLNARTLLPIRFRATSTGYAQTLFVFAAPVAAIDSNSRIVDWRDPAFLGWMVHHNVLPDAVRLLDDLALCLAPKGCTASEVFQAVTCPAGWPSPLILWHSRGAAFTLLGGVEESVCRRLQAEATTHRSLHLGDGHRALQYQQ